LLIFGWENGISCTGTGIHQQKKPNRKWEWFEELSWTDTACMRRWDLCSWALGFGQNLGLGIRTLFRTLFSLTLSMRRASIDFSSFLEGKRDKKSPLNVLFNTFLVT
jgi:hypothetical protein